MKLSLKTASVVLGYIGSVSAVVLLWRESFMLTLTLFVISALMLVVLRSKKITAVYVFVALWGPLTEAIAIAKGVWHYESPDFFGLPLWLPFLWGAASIVITYSYEYLSRFKDKK